MRLLAPRLEGEDHTKDIDFSPAGIRKRWEAGLADARKALKAAPWEAGVDPIEGFYLHEMREGAMVEKAAQGPAPRAKGRRRVKVGQPTNDKWS